MTAENADRVALVICPRSLAVRWLRSCFYVQVDLTVVDVPERERFEAREADGAVVGVLTYQVTGPIIVLTHTDVGERPDGRDIEDALLRAAMEDARVKDRTVVPMSPAVTAWLDSHREFEKLVARSTKKIRK